MIQRIKNYPWLSFFTLGAFVVLCGLCFWQIERMVWKRNLIAQMDSTLSAPPVEIVKAANFDNLPEFQRVRVKGKLLNAETLHLQARYYKSALGFDLVTPLQLADGSVIFLNRGWVPKDYKTNAKVKITQPEGIVSVVAMIRAKEHPRSYLPQNDPAKGLWLWQDADAWGAQLKAKYPTWKIVPISVQQLLEDGASLDFPLPQEMHFAIRNDHLQYAITWGALAIALLVIYGVFTKQTKK